jgi:hypothetical protein
MTYETPMSNRTDAFANELEQDWHDANDIDVYVVACVASVSAAAARIQAPQRSALNAFLDALHADRPERAGLLGDSDEEAVLDDECCVPIRMRVRQAF